MSSPFEPETKKGVEESLEAMRRTTTWAGRIDSHDVEGDIDISGFISDLEEERERLLNHYRLSNTERAIDNFVVNQIDVVVDIFTGNLDTKVEKLKEVRDYVNNEFGYIRPFDLTRENYLWLLAQEVSKKVDREFIDEYTEEPFSSMDFDSVGEQPPQWDTYPET